MTSSSLEADDVVQYLTDVNVLLALTLSGHPHHDSAVRWLGGVDDADSVLLCRATQQSLLRLLTTRAVFAPFDEPPLTNEEAWAVADALLADPRFVPADIEPPGVHAVWRGYSSHPSPSPKRWVDAYLVAFARVAGARFVTIDGAFRSYQGLDHLILST